MGRDRGAAGATQPAVGKSWQLLPILNANTDVQQRTVGTIIFQVMEMENRRGRRGKHSRGGVELADARSDPRPDLPPTPGRAAGTLPVLVPKPRIPFAAVVTLREMRGRAL